jgi:hypothetical protein
LAARVVSVRFRSWADDGSTLWVFSVLVADGIILVVVALADQPAKDARGVGRVGDARLAGLAVEGLEVILGDRAPVRIAVAPACPTFDAGEEALDARTVAVNYVVVSANPAGNYVGIPFPIGFF